MTSLFSLTLTFYLSLATPLFVPPRQLSPDQCPLTKVTPGIFVSDWEPASSWETSRNQEVVQYAFTHKLPKLQTQQLKESQLIVFVKGYQFKDSSAIEKPLSLPFYFFLPEEKALKPQYWNYTASSDQLEITLQAPVNEEDKLSQTKENVQIRYFLVDKAFLKQQKLSPRALRGLSYQQLLQLTSQTP
jgi:hypothetical protein